MKAKSSRRIIIKTIKVLVCTIVSIAILIAICLLTCIIMVEKRNVSYLRELYHIPEEKVTISSPLNTYTDISKLKLEDDMLFSATKLSKEIDGTTLFKLYTIENSDDAIGNIYACLDYPDANSESKIYVKDATLVPRSVNAETISDVSVSPVDSDYIYLHLSKEQIAYLQYLVFDKLYDLSGFSDMEEDGSFEEQYRIHFHVKGITGLYYNSPTQFIQKNNKDGKYYLQNGVGKYMLLPDDLQNVLKAALENLAENSVVS